VSDNVKQLMRDLAAPFDANQVHWKPQNVKDNRAMAVAYLDARAVQDRLDRVLGAENWADDYQVLPDNCVLCRLKLRLGGEWVQKVDVGAPSEQPDEGDRRKAAFSDALKRAAVKFGIGRYLYNLPKQWCDYDPKKRQFAKAPSLPKQALPAAAPKPGTATQKSETATQKASTKVSGNKRRPPPPTPAERHASYLKFQDAITAASAEELDKLDLRVENAQDNTGAWYYTEEERAELHISVASARQAMQAQHEEESENVPLHGDD
jgi:hypothetical protein